MIHNHISSPSQLAHDDEFIEVLGMEKHPLAGRKQTPEQIRKRIEAVARTRATWTDEQRESFANKVRVAVQNRDPEVKRKFAHCHDGKSAWNKGKKCPQFSGPNHWNWGNNMPQESIEKMRQSLTGKKQSAEVVQLRVEARAGYSHSINTRVKIGTANSAERNGNWLGGVSREPYALIWGSRLFKESIKDRDGNVCQNPMCHGDCGVLSIHHIDYDKKNCDRDNPITLCRSCNARANFNRDFWEAGYKEIVRLKYDADRKLIAV